MGYYDKSTYTGTHKNGGPSVVGTGRRKAFLGGQVPPEMHWSQRLRVPEARLVQRRPRPRRRRSTSAQNSSGGRPAVPAATVTAVDTSAPVATRVVAEQTPVATATGVKVSWPGSTIQAHAPSMPVLLGQVHLQQRKKHMARDAASTADTEATPHAVELDTLIEADRLRRSPRGQSDADPAPSPWWTSGLPPAKTYAAPVDIHVVPRLRLPR